MRQTSRAGSWGLAIAMTHLAATATATAKVAADDAPPPLTLPGGAQPAVVVKPATPEVRSAPRPSTNLLRPRATVAARPAAAVPPPLIGPAEMRVPPPSSSSTSSSGTAISTRRMPAQSPRDEPSAMRPATPPSLLLEPDPLDDLEPLPSVSPFASDGDGEGDGDLDRGEVPPLDRIEPEMPRTSPSPKRRLGMFPPLTNPNRSRSNASSDSSIRVEPRSDPAADAALKRRLKSKIEDAVGDRADDVEVRVVNRNVVVRAKVDRFWNKRGVRRTIENLPALAGYKARVEIE